MFSSDVCITKNTHIHLAEIKISVYQKPQGKTNEEVIGMSSRKVKNINRNNNNNEVEIKLFSP